MLYELLTRYDEVGGTYRQGAWVSVRRLVAPAQPAVYEPEAVGR